MFHSLSNVRIAGLRGAVPANEIRLEDEVQYYGGSKKKIARMTATLGMDRRRVCLPDVTASDLCACAANELLAAMPECREKADVLIFVSQSPDWHQPATACELQNRLNLPVTCAAFDVNQGCAGYIYGLWLASSLVSAGSARTVLLLVGDASPIGRDPENRVIAPVFGDGGSATLIVRDEGASLLYFGFGTDGSGFEIITVPAGQARIPFMRDAAKNEALVESVKDKGGNPWILSETYMDGGAVFNFTMDVVPDHLKKMMARAGLSLDEINYLVLHQANRQIVRMIAEKTGFPQEKVPDESFGKYGNLAAASVPVALCDSFGTTPAPGRLLMCGYGIGLSWGSCICDIKDWNCAPPIDFEPDPNRPTRQQRIERWQKIFSGEVSRHDQI